MQNANSIDVDEAAILTLTYWFGIEYWKNTNKEPANATAYYDSLWRERWFAKEELTKVVDDYIRLHFEEHVKKALNGNYDNWTKTSHGTLALIVLLDQFTRNIYRFTKDAWIGDEKALSICLNSIEKGIDKGMKPVSRAMLYMPLMHVEDFELSKKALELFTNLHEEAKNSHSLTEQVLERFKKAAARHYHVISLFGRYPERNKYLGRPSKPEEKAYLNG